MLLAEVGLAVEIGEVRAISRMRSWARADFDGKIDPVSREISYLLREGWISIEKFGGNRWVRWLLQMKDLKTRQTLLLRIRDAEDDRAWGEFVDLYSPVIFGFCRKRGLQEADAADVVQDVMKSVSQHIGKFDYDPGKGTFRSWLYTVTRNELSRHFRKRARQPQGTGRTTIMKLVEDQPDPDAEADWDTEYRRQLFHWAADRVKADFTEQTWSAFWRTAVDQESAGEVAEELGISVGAAYIAKSRVMSRIGETIESIAGEWDLPAQMA